MARTRSAGTIDLERLLSDPRIPPDAKYVALSEDLTGVLAWGSSYEDALANAQKQYPKVRAPFIVSTALADDLLAL